MTTATVSEVFDMTMSLIDELNDRGAAQTADTEEYKNRTLGILGMLVAECFPYSDLKGAETADSAFRLPEDFDDNLYRIDNTLAYGILPYGLAANLLVDENPAAAGFYQQRYEELLRQKRSRAPADSGEIENVYGGLGYGWFSRWG